MKSFGTCRFELRSADHASAITRTRSAVVHRENKKVDYYGRSYQTSYTTCNYRPEARTSAWIRTAKRNSTFGLNILPFRDAFEN